MDEIDRRLEGVSENPNLDEIERRLEGVSENPNLDEIERRLEGGKNCDTPRKISIMKHDLFPLINRLIDNNYRNIKSSLLLSKYLIGNNNINVKFWNFVFKKLPIYKNIVIRDKFSKYDLRKNSI